MLRTFSVRIWMHKTFGVVQAATVRASSSRPHRVRTSNQFLPTRNVKLADTTSLGVDDGEVVKSLKWMLKLGLLRRSSAGVYHLLPLALRSLEKLTGLIDGEMKAIGAAKMAMPILTPASLWKKTGRWVSVGPELLRLTDQADNDYCLGPTHEEPITQLIADEQLSYRQLPLRLYQLDRKFRDEKRPRFGLLRCREFWMKDMYSFDASEEAAQKTYMEVCQAYERILTKLELPVVKVRADTGNIGGSLSHEYHIPNTHGEDTLLTCKRCGLGASRELLGGGDITSLPECPYPSENVCQLSETRGIEVAHAFFLGTKYSEPFGATFTTQQGEQKLLEMGCFGVGVSRLLAAALEYGLSGESERLTWPTAIAPYHICVACLARNGSDPVVQRSESVYDQLSQLYPGDVLLEDRIHLTLGSRLKYCSELGYPVVVLVGHKTPEGKFELWVQVKKKNRCVWESHVVDENRMHQLIEQSFVHR